ncbi:MAG: TPM domain-containing protein, partial [Cyanobacteriota bacterium]
MPNLKRALGCLLATCVVLLTWAVSPAYAFDNPELLPDVETPIIDLADTLTSIQEQQLIANLDQLEAETGYKLRVLTQFDRTPGRAVKEFW